MILRSLRIILRSLRARVIAGAFLWTVGLLVLVRVASDVASEALADVFPGFRPVDHLVLSCVGTACAIAGLLIVARGMRRLDRVSESVSAVRSGETDRLDASGLTEIEPLVRDMNVLLEQRETAVRRALAAAGDLAHGLKTPLAILAQEADRLEGLDQHASAETISEQVERMLRHLDCHLARSRASGGVPTYGFRTEIGAVIPKLVSTMQKLYASRALTFEIGVDQSVSVRCEPEDFEEMFGNLLDNACKWAASTVTVTAARNGQEVMLLVGDDGAGVEPSMLGHILDRGARADEVAPGHGLGLAIVTDLSRLYGGSLAIDSGRGGFRARLVLPSC